MDEATVIAQIVANTQLGIMFDTEVDKDVPIDPDDYEIANAILSAGYWKDSVVYDESTVALYPKGTVFVSHKGVPGTGLNAVLIVIEEGAEVTITPRPPEGPLSVGDYLPANVVWVP